MLSSNYSFFLQQKEAIQKSFNMIGFPLDAYIYIEVGVVWAKEQKFREGNKVSKIVIRYHF